MKKSLSMLAFATLCCFSLFAGEGDIPVPKDLTFRQVRNAALTPERAESIQSVRAIYEVTGKNIPRSFFMIRAQKYDKVRLDGIRGDEYFCVSRNGKNFWTYNAKDGAMAMEPADVVDFKRFIAFLAVPFSKDNDIFENPVYVKEEMLGKTLCTRFNVKPKNDDEVQFAMWIENKSRQLHRVEVTDADGDNNVNTYRNYQKFNGISLPGTIYITNVKGTFVMKLISADWNVEFSDTLFKKSEEPKDKDVSMLMKSEANTAAKSEQKKVVKDKAREERLTKQIRVLKIEIANLEKKLDSLEKIFFSNRSDTTTLAMITSGGSRSSYWNGCGWTSSSNRAANRDAQNRRKVLKNKEAENKVVIRDYKELDALLLKKQKELSDLEYALERLHADKE